MANGFAPAATARASGGRPATATPTVTSEPRTCPPDRSHDITAVTTRQAEVQTEIEPLVYRHNELADRRLKGPGTRNEMRCLREQIGDLSEALGRLATEMDAHTTGCVSANSS